MANGAELEAGVGKERTIAFSDGVFAIAITLLVLNLEVPDLSHESGSALRHALSDLAPAVVSYFIGFYVIGRFWMGHHRLFDNLRGLDYRLLNLNLLYLAFIALLPFPTSLLGDHPDIALAVAIFAGAVVLAGLTETAILWAALRAELTSPEVRLRQRAYFYEALITPAVFIASIPIAFANATAAKYFWLVLLPARQVARRVGLMP